jgi:hypothetical protein
MDKTRVVRRQIVKPNEKLDVGRSESGDGGKNLIFPILISTEEEMNTDRR